ncbi:acetylglutamate kinase [Flavobacterium sp. SM15]|uniref:acetylglutamate kinase n=1 Tax=Flavobacterium sp. SM15 TaxID=2908005 RepID=UPI001EDC83F3|nr:acetylglutamate kinase [Flavobacterium sp. SM15]MCG2612073.1 acetylglutamate kinase [Flavobacterium sp. SM15]
MKTIKPKLTIIKIGGNVIDDAQSFEEVLNNFSKIDGPKILVHGGGKEASKFAEKLGLSPKLVDGRRITDAAMLDVAVMTYAGLINKKIVGKLNALDTIAFGMSGADGKSIISEKRKNSEIDFGYVGNIISINKDLITSFLNQGIVPVFCAITQDNNGQLLNTNADTIASTLASGLAENFEVELFYCFEKNGVLINPEDENSMLPLLTFSKYEDLMKVGAIHSGMIPKLENCFQALQNRVQSVIIGNHSEIKSKSIYTEIKL